MHGRCPRRRRGRPQMRARARARAAGRAMKFLLDMETMEAEHVLGPDVICARKAYPSQFPWPPSLRACKSDNNARAT